MSIREYVGARYVLKIYENSLDPLSADWESNTSYEPLTMVNYNNSSYISRKDVPANIGNPVDNPTYWALSGLYNGQIANLQNQINNIITDLGSLMADWKERQTLADRKFVFIADSYGVLSDMLTDAVSYLGLSSNQYEIEARNAYSFVGEDGILKFLDLLSVALARISDLDTVTDIVVVGGINDSTNAFTDTGELADAMIAFDSYARTNCPNAQIHLGYIGYCDISNPNAAGRDATKQFVTLQRYVKNAATLGWHYMTNIEYTLRGWDSLLSDGVHPNSNGASALGAMIAQGILTGACDAIYCGLNTTTLTIGTLPSTVSAASVSLGMYSITNNVTSFTINPISLTFDYGSAVNFGNLSFDLPITDYPFKLLDNSKPIVVNMNGTFAYDDNGTKYMQCPVIVSFLQGKINIKPLPFINGSNNWITAIPLSLTINVGQNVAIDTIRI